MSDIVGYQDLFDLPGIKAAFDELKAANSAFAHSAIAEIKALRKQTEGLKSDLKAISATSFKVNLSDPNAEKKIHDLIEQTRELGNAKRKVVGETALLDQSLKLSDVSVDKLKKGLKSLVQEFDRLDPTAADFAKTQQRIAARVDAVRVAIDTQSAALRQGKKTIDTARGSYNALHKDTEQLKRDLKAMPDAFNQTTGAINRQNAAAVELQRQIEQNVRSLKRMDAAQGDHRRNVGDYGKAIAGLNGVLGLVGKVASGVGLATGGLDIADQLAEIGSEYEKLDLLVENSFEGNIRLTKEAKAVIKDFADNSPNLIEETTLAFNRLRDIGINPTKADLVKLSDMAIAKKKTIADYVEAIADAQMGENERLKEFGINAQKNGDKVSFTFKGVTTTVQASQKAITEYLIELGKTRGVIGAADRLAQASSGRVSTMKDTWAGVASVLFEQVQPAYNGAIGWLTSLGNGLKSLFTPAVDSSSQALSTQSQKVAELEGKLSGLLTRYDELKSKSNKSAAEQKELQSVINQITTLVPSAATGFDSYGNALDVNRSKVMGFTAAQRELNAELNKAAILDLKNQAARKKLLADQAQSTLNAGQEQAFGLSDLKPFFLKTQDERRRATAKTEAERRMKPLSDKRITELQGEAASASADVLNSYKQIISLGGKLDAAARQYIQQSGDFSAKQLLVVDDFQTKIAEKTAQAADLFQKGAFKQREAIVKEIAALKTDLDQILNPSAGGGPRLSNQTLGGGAGGEKQLSELEKFQHKLQEVAKLLLDEAFADLRAGNAIALDPEQLKRFEKLYQIALKLKDVAPGLLGGQVNDVIALFRSLNGPIGGELPVVSPPEGLPEISFSAKELEAQKKEREEREKERQKRQEDHEKEHTDTLNRTAEAYEKRVHYERRLTTDFRNLSDEKKAEYQRLLDGMAQATEKNNKRLADAYEKDLKDFGDKQDGKKAKTLAILEESLRLAGEFGQAIFDVSSAYRQRDLENLNRQKSHELELAGNNADARKRIEERFAEKQRELKIRQAKAERAMALFQIVIQTASAVMANILTPFLIPFIIATAAVQTAAVLAAPLPQFAKGTRNAPGGLAVVGEAGPELIVSPKGQAAYVEKPSIVPLEKGSTVYTAGETKRLLEQAEASRILETSRARGRLADDIQHNHDRQIRDNFTYALKTAGMDYDRMKGVFAEAFKEHTTQVFIDGQEAQRQRQAKITRHVQRRNSFT